MPLFLELLRDAALRDPELGRAALAGLVRYQAAAAPPARPERAAAASVGPATLRDCGGDGPLLVLVPSLINPPEILDLDPASSLAGALSDRHRVLLLDWGPAEGRAGLDLVGHVDTLLIPLLAATGPARLVGYCLGGTLALAAARQSSDVTAVATLAAPWDFAAYPAEANATLQRLWVASRPVAQRLGFLPMEVLQAAFWQMDPARIVAKFARFAAMPNGAAEADRFVAMEDWANGGEPLPLPAAAALVEGLFGTGARGMGALPDCPMLHVTAQGDRIVPAASAAPGPRLDCPAGHVGMIAGRDAPRLLHAPLRSWLEGLAARG